MPEDTQPPFTVEETPPPSVQTKTETKIESIETEVAGGKRHRQAGELLGMSGRFWVSMAAILGFIYLSRIGINLIKETPNIDPVATAFIGGIIGAFGGAATTILGNYMGQNTGPSKSRPS